MPIKRKTELKSSIDATRMTLKDHVADANDNVEAQWDSQMKAIEEAEYAILDAVDARNEADAKAAAAE